jgi:DNA-binding protein YbaB
VNGKLELTNLDIHDDFSHHDIRGQKTMIKTAVNNAISSAQKTTQEKMNSVTGGMLGDMNIPGM